MHYSLWGRFLLLLGLPVTLQNGTAEPGRAVAASLPPLFLGQAHPLPSQN